MQVFRPLWPISTAAVEDTCALGTEGSLGCMVLQIRQRSHRVSLYDFDMKSKSLSGVDLSTVFFFFGILLTQPIQRISSEEKIESSQLICFVLPLHSSKKVGEW